MVLSLIQMVKNTRLTGKNPKASHGGLTPPKLYDSGADFRIAFAKNTEGRQVRISCRNVTFGLSSVVFISHMNQLPICHTPRFAESQVLQKCFGESLLKCHCGKNVTSRCKNVTLQKCHTWVLPKCHTLTPQWKMTPPVENDRAPDGK